MKQIGHRDNPFSDYGNVIAPSRFVGRQREVNLLYQRVLSSAGGGCIAVVGEKKIGKTSLIQYAFQPGSPEIKAVQGVIVAINVSYLRDQGIHGFFGEIINKIHQAIEQQWEEYTEQASVAFQDVWKNAPLNMGHKVNEYLRAIRRLGFRVILLLDEFDSIEYIFGNELAPYLVLREIGGSPSHYGTILVTSSRVDITSIEISDRLISSLSPIFTVEHLKLMSDADFNQLMKKRLEDSPIKLARKELDFIRLYVGTHPYLSQLLAFHIWNEKSLQDRKQALPDQVLEDLLQDVLWEILPMFRKYSERMSKQQLEILNKVVCGKAENIPPIQIKYFFDRGLIVRDDRSRIFRAFGKIYEDYLCQAQIPIPNYNVEDETGQLRRYMSAIIMSRTSKNQYRVLITKLGKTSHWELPKIPHETQEPSQTVLNRLLEHINFDTLFPENGIEQYEPISVRKFKYEMVDYFMCTLSVQVDQIPEDSDIAFLSIPLAREHLEYSDDRLAFDEAVERFLFKDEREER